MILDHIINIYYNYHNTKLNPDIHKIPSVSYKNFKKVQKFYFNSTFSNLVDKYKLLYNDEVEYENIKSKIKHLKHIYLARDLTLLSFSYICFSKLFKYLEHQIEKPYRQIYPKRLLTFLLTFGLNYLITRNYYVDLSNIVSLKSKLGMYFWFEFRFRQGVLNNNNINALDNIVLNDIEIVKNNKIKSKERIEKVLFYLSMKRHYLSLIISERVLLELNGDKYRKNFVNEKRISELFHFRKFLDSEIWNVVGGEDAYRDVVLPKIDETNNDLNNYITIEELDSLYSAIQIEDSIKSGLLK
jgi:hypothetical protein